jgi:predicted deacetylase
LVTSCAGVSAALLDFARDMVTVMNSVMKSSRAAKVLLVVPKMENGKTLYRFSQTAQMLCSKNKSGIK